MPRVPLDHPATYDDLIAQPERVVAEIVDGELHASPRPSPRHAVAAFELGNSLGPPFGRGHGGPGGWLILAEPELHLGVDVLIPDLAGWRRERMTTLPTTAFFTLAPDWICEVLSPSTEHLDRGQKLPIYARAGVAYAWLADPIARTLEAFERDDTGWVLLSCGRDTDVVRAAPFDAVPLELALLWSR